MRRAHLLVAILILLGLAGAAVPSEGAKKKAPAKPSPCNDERYRQLRDKPESEMTKDERKYVDRKGKECTEYQVAQAKAKKTHFGSAKKTTKAKPAPAGKRAPSAKPAPSGQPASSAKAAPSAKAATRAKPAAPAAATKSPQPSAPPQNPPPQPMAKPSVAPQPHSPAKPSAPAPPPAARKPAYSHPDDLGRERNMAITFHGGIAPSSGIMTDYHGSGLSFGTGLAYPLNDRFGLDLVTFGVDHFPLDDAQAQQQATAPPGGSITLVSLTSGVRARFASGFVLPYGALGIGLFRAAHWDLELPGGEVIKGADRTSVGWTIGAGIERHLGERSTAFTEVRATFASTAYQYSAYYPVRGGFRIDLR